MPITQLIPLVLASGSAIRAQMLKNIGLQFSVAPSAVDEDAIKAQMTDKTHADLALALASAKTAAVAVDYPDHIVIGADQLCICGDTRYDKPMQREQAEKQLRELSGKTHHQMSAVCVMRGGKVVWQTVETATLTMRELNDSEIAAYIQQDQPLQSCGAYKFEAMGRHLFSRVEGDHDVIKGLPLVSLIFTLYNMNAIQFG